MSTEQSATTKVLKAGSGRIDRAKVLATTEDDIERHQREDDEVEVNPASWQVVVPGPDVRALREGMGLKQDEFADRFGISLRTLQQWEQKRRVPDGPARTLLELIETAPKTMQLLVATKNAGASYDEQSFADAPELGGRSFLVEDRRPAGVFGGSVRGFIGGSIGGVIGSSKGRETTKS